MFFLAGILFYQIKFAKGDWHEHVLIGICFLAAVLAHPGLTLFYVFVFIFLLFYLFVYDQLKFFSWRPFIFLGYISYPLYLLHQNIGFVLMRKMEQYIGNEYLVILITMVLIVTLSWLVTRFLEKPILQFLRNYRIQGRRYSGSLQK
ncbi:Acyltransferase family protein [compost metagenome]